MTRGRDHERRVSVEGTGLQGDAMIVITWECFVGMSETKVKRVKREAGNQAH